MAQSWNKYLHSYLLISQNPQATALSFKDNIKVVTGQISVGFYFYLQRN
jgi:hypothetical protein